jgi:WD40 repeat protein
MLLLVWYGRPDGAATPIGVRFQDGKVLGFGGNPGLFVLRYLINISKRVLLVGLAVSLASPFISVIAKGDANPTQHVIYGVKTIVFDDRGKTAAITKGNLSSGIEAYRPGLHRLAENTDQVEVWETENSKLLRTFSDFGAGLFDARVSPDGRLLATMSWESTANEPGRRIGGGSRDDRAFVKLWDVGTGELRWSKVVFQGAILMGAFSPDGRNFAVLGCEWSPPGNLKVLDVQSGGVLSKVSYREYAGGIVFSRDGSRLAVRKLHSGYRSEVKIYDFPALKERLTIAEPKDINSLPELSELRFYFGSGLLMRVRELQNIALSPDGNHLAFSLSGAKKGRLIHQILCFDAQAGTLEQTITINNQPFPKDKHLNQQSRNGVMFHSAALEACQRNRRAVTELIYLSDNRSIAALNLGVAMAVWDVRSGEVRWQGRSSARSTAAAFSADGRLIAFAYADGAVNVWDYANEERKQSFGEPGGVTPGRLNAERLTITAEAVVALGFGGDGLLLGSLSDNHTLKLWDARAASVQARLESQDSSFTCFAVSPTSKQLAVGEQNGRVVLFDLASAQSPREITKDESPVLALDFSPDGKKLAAASEDGLVRILETASGKLEVKINAHHGAVNSVDFSPASEQLASGGADGEVKLWDVHTGKELRTMSGHRDKVHAVAFSPDGRFLASASADRTVRLWDPGNGRLVKVLGGRDSIALAVVFAPNGMLLASGGGDGTVRLWSVPEGKSLRALKGHETAVNALAFSPNGATLAAASANNSIAFWNPQTGELMRVLKDAMTIMMRQP